MTLPATVCHRRTPRSLPTSSCPAKFLSPARAVVLGRPQLDFFLYDHAFAPTGMGASEARAAKVGQANDLGGHPWVRRASTRPYRGSEGARALFHADRAGILIGGTAAALTMEEAGLEFRATKDVDIVLHVEALTPAFGKAFWKFVEDGGYEIRHASDTGH